MSDIFFPKIQIAVCSHKRPQMLTNTLRSLGEMILPENTCVSLVVVDNDENRSAESTVLEFKERLPFPVTYHNEPRRGIPMARNHALRAAIREETDYLIFIDDDEWVEKEWFQNLCGFAIKQNPPALVAGYVISDLPDSTPKYLHPFFQRRALPEGTRRKLGATNNLWIPIEVITRFNLFFDENHPLNGGEDTRFTQEVRKKGVEILFCPQAIVHETITKNRATLQWLSTRKFRAGNCRSLARREAGGSMTAFFFSQLLAGLGNLLFAGAAALFIQRTTMLHRWFRVCKSAGSCYGVLGGSFNNYRTTDGH